MTESSQSTMPKASYIDVYVEVPQLIIGVRELQSIVNAKNKPPEKTIKVTINATIDTLVNMYAVLTAPDVEHDAHKKEALYVDVMSRYLYEFIEAITTLEPRKTSQNQRKSRGKSTQSTSWTPKITVESAPYTIFLKSAEYKSFKKAMDEYTANKTAREKDHEIDAVCRAEIITRIKDTHGITSSLISWTGHTRETLINHIAEDSKYTGSIVADSYIEDRLRDMAISHLSKTRLLEVAQAYKETLCKSTEALLAFIKTNYRPNMHS